MLIAEDKVSTILEPTKVMGIVPKPLLLFLSLFSARFQRLRLPAENGRLRSFGADTTPKIIGPKGQLSPEDRAGAIMERLKGQVAPTDILERYSLLIEVISGSSLVTGNKVTLLIDGPATDEAMFKAIRGPKTTVNLETFIFLKTMRLVVVLQICFYRNRRRGFRSISFTIVLGA